MGRHHCDGAFGCVKPTCDYACAKLHKLTAAPRPPCSAGFAVAIRTIVAMYGCARCELKSSYENSGVATPHLHLRPLAGARPCPKHGSSMLYAKSRHPNACSLPALLPLTAAPAPLPPPRPHLQFGATCTLHMSSVLILQPAPHLPLGRPAGTRAVRPPPACSHTCSSITHKA